MHWTNKNNKVVETKFPPVEISHSPTYSEYVEEKESPITDEIDGNDQSNN